MNCLTCGRPFDPARFPLARPRRDGTRHPFRYCDECLSGGRYAGDARLARLRANRECEQRRRDRMRRERQLADVSSLTRSA